MNPVASAVGAEGEAGAGRRGGGQEEPFSAVSNPFGSVAVRIEFLSELSLHKLNSFRRHSLDGAI